MIGNDVSSFLPWLNLERCQNLEGLQQDQVAGRDRFVAEEGVQYRSVCEFSCLENSRSITWNRPNHLSFSWSQGRLANLASLENAESDLACEVARRFEVQVPQPHAWSSTS